MTLPAPNSGSATARPSQQETIRLVGEALEQRLRRLPYVLGVFFAGSAANGELIVDTRAGYRLLSDVEVGVVTTRPWKKRDIRAIAADVGITHDVDVDAFLVTRTRLSQGLHKNIGLSTRSATIFAYEISTAARWLYGHEHVKCRTWQASDIHPWEGVRLVLNRVGEGAPWLLQDSDTRDSVERSRWLIKSLIAAGDALLLSAGEFAPSYSDRAKMWQLHGATLLPEAEARAAIAKAYQDRAAGLTAPVEVSDEALLEAIRGAVWAGLAASGCRLGGSTARSNAKAIRSALREAAPPTLHTLGWGRLDAAFDSLLRLPRIRHSRVRTRAVLADWRGRGCLQHWAYAPLIAGLTEPELRHGFAVMRDALRPVFRGDELSQGAFVQEWWQAMCK